MEKQLSPLWVEKQKQIAARHLELVKEFEAIHPLRGPIELESAFLLKKIAELEAKIEDVKKGALTWGDLSSR